MRFWYLLVAPGLVLAGIAAAPIVAAPIAAAADCTTSDNMTLCSLGDEDGDLPTLPSTSSGNRTGNPGYSYGPGNNYDRYYDDGYRWFTP
ncbi:MAG: hypothetical protein K0U84_20885 [Actinomycetia bacterium]|nr:hypothetical protein [Actinomycetes bacterium]